MQRGEVWWADLPAPVGRRPVLILTRDPVVNVRGQLVVAQITRTVHNIAAEAPLTARDGLPQDCVVNCDVLMTVPKNRLQRRITQLNSARMEEVANALRFALEIA